MVSLTIYWLQVSAFILFGCFVITALVPFISHVQTIILPTEAPEAASFRASKNNVWVDLSRQEAQELTKFLLSKAELNLTEAAKATSHDNQLHLIELIQPNKTDVLAYLNGTAGPPDRWARVVIQEGTTEQAQYAIYAAGPLPSSDSMEIIPLTYCYNSGRNWVVNPTADLKDLVGWLMEVSADISDILTALLGSQVDPYDPGKFNAARPELLRNGSMTAWVSILGKSVNPDSSFVLSQGLFFKIYIEGRHSSQWKVLQWYYNDVLYESADHLRKAIKSPDFRKSLLNLDGAWTVLEDFSEGLPDRKNPPPVMVDPAGARFKVDEKEKFISWMGYEFFITTSSDTGVALHDIRFNGDRVIFELGLQETFVTYASDDPKQGGQDFLDSGFLMGFRMVELVPGYDCPAYATFLSTEYHIHEQVMVRKNSICIFEYTADYPLQRHTSGSVVSVGKNTYMVVRFVSTIGNYDYTFDYVFYLDGTIEVKVRASGFIFGVFWNENSSPRSEYGFRVHDAAATSIHDHVLNFKADLDVSGTANTMVRIGVEPVTKYFPWDDAETTPRNTMHLVSHIVEKETGMNWAPNSGEILLVVNDNATNLWGEKKGYRIQPGSGIGAPSHRVVANSTSSGFVAEWATQDLWILKRKDTEPKSSTVFQAFSPMDPLVDFRKFVDNEDIVDDDVVVFFNLGHHHVPHSGDIPNTLMHTSASSVMFTPFNFHDSDPTRRSAQGVRIDNNGATTKVQYYGGRYHEGVSLGADDLEPDQANYNGPQEDYARESSLKSVANFVALGFDL